MPTRYEWAWSKGVVGMGRGTYRVRGYAFEPIIVEIKEHHLWLCGFENEVSQLLHFETGLEG